MQLRPSVIFSMIIVASMFILGSWNIIQRIADVNDVDLAYTTRIYELNRTSGIASPEEQQNVFSALGDSINSAINAFVSGVELVIKAISNSINVIGEIKVMFELAGGVLGLNPIISDAIGVLITVGTLYGLYSIRTGGLKI